MKAREWYLRKFGWIPRPVRQVIVLVIGGTLLLLGLLGLVLPVMPGFIFIPFALAVLAAEFAWAARWLLHIRRSAKNIQTQVRNGGGSWPARAAVKTGDFAVKCWRGVCSPFARRTTSNIAAPPRSPLRLPHDRPKISNHPT